MSDTRVVTLDELKAHNKKDDFYVLVNGKGASMMRWRVLANHSAPVLLLCVLAAS
jgi:hypothetical protein